MSALSALPAFGFSVALGLAVVLSPMSSGTAFAEGEQAQAPSGVDLARVTALTDSMLMGDIIGVMREEGIDYGRTLAAEMFPDKRGAEWEAVVSLIYDEATMRSRFDAALAEALKEAGPEMAAIEGYIASDPVQRALKLEVEARRTLLDPLAEDAAKLAWEDMKAEGGPRVDQILRFAEVNDLIESNVMGALNANLAFYRGLAESGAFPDEMTEDQMLADVWGQEAEVRSDTEAWLFPFLSLAYLPLEDSDMAAYIDFSASPAGQRLNAALFAAFDLVFTRISYDLGRAAAKQMQGEDI